MATELKIEGELPLNIPAGMAVAFKSSAFNLTGNHLYSPETCLDLHNINNDIILRISIRRDKKKVFFNDRAGKCWGEEKSVELSPVDIDRWERSGVTISVRDCSTPAKTQYRIAFDVTPVCCFDGRFPGPVIKVKYSRTVYGRILLLPSLSSPLKVFTYEPDDQSEKKVIGSGRRVDCWGGFLIAHKDLVFSLQLLLQVQQRFLSKLRISPQIHHVHLSVGMMGKR